MNLLIKALVTIDVDVVVDAAVAAVFKCRIFIASDHGFLAAHIVGHVFAIKSFFVTSLLAPVILKRNYSNV